MPSRTKKGLFWYRTEDRQAQAGSGRTGQPPSWWGQKKKPTRWPALEVYVIRVIPERDQELSLKVCVNSGCCESCNNDESNYVANHLESLHPSLTAPAHCLEH